MIGDWRLAPSGRAHCYRRELPHAIPVCSAAIPRRYTSFVAAPGAVRCRTCARIQDRSESARARWEAEHPNHQPVDLATAIRRMAGLE